MPSASRISSRSDGARSGKPGWSARNLVPSVVARCAAMTSACGCRRMELGQPVPAGRRDGEAGHDGDDAIELEGPQGARMHG